MGGRALRRHPHKVNGKAVNGVLGLSALSADSVRGHPRRRSNENYLPNDLFFRVFATGTALAVFCP